MTREEAPEKIYISNFDIEALPKSEQLSERWHEVSTQETDIEYTRTDAFIEKAEMYLKGRLLRYIDLCVRGVGISTEEFIEKFKNYMKGV